MLRSAKERGSTANSNARRSEGLDTDAEFSLQAFGLIETDVVRIV